MKTELFLDYQTVLANRAVPVHFAVRFQADEVTIDRPQPAAFCVVLDRSASMEWGKLDQARKATEVAVRNLRRNDLFGLVVFDDQCQTIVPLQSVSNRQEVLSLISRINVGGSTNLTGGWMLGRDELKKAPDGVSRRLLLLSDGELNVGIIEPVAVNQIVATGLEQDKVRTSCLGFGEGYNEDLMAEMARVTGGKFYDAQSPEQLPAIFASELEGLQKLAVQNLRVRIKPLDFCEQIALLGNYPVVKLPDGRYELSMGDLMSDEERVVCFALEVLPLPCIEGQPVASLEGEKLLEVEFQYDELRGQSVHSKTESRVVRIQATTNPDEVKVNEEVVSWVALQQAGKVADAVTKKIDSGDVTGAEAELKAVIDKLQKYGSGTGSADAVRLLTELVQRLETRHDMGVTRKSARYYSSSFGRMSSTDAWTGPGLPPGFKLRRRGPVSLSTPLDIPDDLAEALHRSLRVTVLTGAGISAESGIPTFRDAATGFWANYDPQKLASPEGFQADPGLVTRWYDERRQQCAAVKPNPGHMAIAQMEKWYESRNGIFTLLTQTVDRLHQAAGSEHAVELHGTLWVWRCVKCGQEQEERGGPFPSYPPLCACGGMRRPSVVWFGEALPKDALFGAEMASRNCDLFFSVGTSSTVYPVAVLAREAKKTGACVVEINTEATNLTPHADCFLQGKAGEVLPLLVQRLG